MVASLQVHRVYQSDIVVVEDVLCRPCTPACGGEEQAVSNDIVFPRMGSFVKHDSWGRSVADPNHVLFFRQGESYEISHPVDGGDSCTVFSFADDVLREGLDELCVGAPNDNGTVFPQSHCGADSNAWLLHHRLHRRLVAGGTQDVTSDEWALDLLGAVAKNLRRQMAKRHRNSRPRTERAHHDIAHAAQLVLAGHYRSAPSLTELARIVHSSPFHLSRLFRRIVGVPIHRYLNALRLRASLERLAEGEPDLTRLALDLGYSSHGHFSTAFHREFAFTPAQFRSKANSARLRQMSKNLKVLR